MVKYDSHCHLSPRITWSSLKDVVVPRLEQTNIEMNIMGTNHIDFDMICELLKSDGINQGVNFSIGIHPWWSHLYTFDTEIISMIENNEEAHLIKELHYNSVLERTKYSTDEELQRIISILPIPFSINVWKIKFSDMLKEYGNDKLNIGELGLDKGFRIPDCGYLGIDDPNSKLSSLKVSLNHQAKVMEFQLKLARKYKRWVSVHNVNCAGRILEFINKYKDLKWVLHSYSGSVDSAKQIAKIGDVWFGLSNVINMQNETKIKEIIQAIGNRVLIETDLGVDCMDIENHLNELNKIEEMVSQFNIGDDNWRVFQSNATK